MTSSFGSVDSLQSELSKPLVSIVIPCFNAENTIGEAIQSALDQDYPNREVIVIDDGSTDRSVELIRAFGTAIRWETGANCGGSAARNRGVSLAQGTFIQFLDADDVLHRNRLSVMVPEAILSGDRCLVASGWMLEREDRTTVNEKLPVYTDEDPVEWILSNDLQTSAPLHWKRVLTGVGGFRLELPRCQEFDLHLRLFATGLGIRIVPQALYRFRRQPNSVSADHVRILLTRREVQAKMAEQLLITNTQRAWVHAIARQIAVDARILVRLGEDSEAARSFDLAWKLWGDAVQQAFSEPLASGLIRVTEPIKAEKTLLRVRKWLRRT